MLWVSGHELLAFRPEVTVKQPTQSIIQVLVIYIAFDKMYLKMASMKFQPFCSDFNVLLICTSKRLSHVRQLHAQYHVYQWAGLNVIMVTTNHVLLSIIPHFLLSCNYSRDMQNKNNTMLPRSSLWCGHQSRPSKSSCIVNILQVCAPEYSYAPPLRGHPGTEMLIRGISYLMPWRY